jgi:tetraacyldisaccharide 4'-kinase
VVARRAAYRLGVFKTERMPVPVVVVGNLVVGGTGKTPLVLWLVETLRAQGFHPGIVSRGYAASAAEPKAVLAGGDPASYGDEPLLLAERSGAPVWVGHDRVGAARALLVAHPECNVLVSDDGLQHYRLGRDFEVAVEDARGFGNGLMLPAGPLREPRSRRVDATVVNGGTVRGGAFAMALEPIGLFSLRVPAQRIEVQAFRGQRVHAIAGIGHPARFFATLQAMGLAFTPHAFPDHHAYTPRDLAFAECDAVLMTEKDAVKCRAFGRDDLYALRVAARVDASLADLITSRLHGLKAA